ncbi:MAG: IclR family transcriptional regulator [Candidatus Dechloromonas phosphoritropha]|jgi:hypothetical protein
MERYRNEAQQRIFKAVFVLFGHVINGIPPSVLAREIGCSAAVMTRDLANLIMAGVVEKVESTGHYRLTARLPQQCFKVMAAIEHADRRISEVKNRFTRLPDSPVGHSLDYATFPELQHRFTKKPDQKGVNDD